MTPPRIRYGARLNKPIAPNVHPAIRQLLEAQDAAGMTDMDWGERAGYAYQNIVNWRSGRRGPTLKTFVDFAQALGYDVTLTPRQ